MKIFTHIHVEGLPEPVLKADTLTAHL